MHHRYRFDIFVWTRRKTKRSNVECTKLGISTCEQFGAGGRMKFVFDDFHIEVYEYYMFMMTLKIKWLNEQ